MPLARGKLLREEIDKNAAGETVEYRKIYDDGSGGEVIYKRPFTPDFGGTPDLTVVKTDAIGRWEKV